MSSIFQFAVVPGSLLTSLVAASAIAVTARRSSRTDTGPTRIRGGRLPLPESVANLTPADEPALLPANVFVDRLADLTRAQWLEVGRRLVTDQDTLGLRSASWAILDATIADRRLGLAAWCVRDAVETIAYLADHAGPRLSRKDRRLFAVAHAAAEDAALAVLTREHLPAEDLAVLCAPFASSVESGRLTYPTTL